MGALEETGRDLRCATTRLTSTRPRACLGQASVEPATRLHARTTGNPTTPPSRGTYFVFDMLRHSVGVQAIAMNLGL